VEELEGQPLYVNPAFCSMLGSSEGLVCPHDWRTSNSLYR